MDIEDLRAALDAVNPDDWEADGPPYNRIIWGACETRICFMAHSDGADDEGDIAVSNLIVMLKNMAPAIADEVDRLREDNARLTRERDALREALERLGSSEAMTTTFMRRDNHEGLELVARMTFARTTLTNMKKDA